MTRRTLAMLCVAALASPAAARATAMTAGTSEVTASDGRNPPGYVIRVKGVAGDTVIQLLPTQGGGMVRADLLTRLLGGSFDSVGAGRWRLALYGATLELQDGAPFAAYGGFTLPLIEATRVVDGNVHVSLQLFSEIVPRFGIGILWDRARSEVRLFQGIATRAAAPSTPDGSGALTPATPVVAAAATSRPPAATPATAPAANPTTRVATSPPAPPTRAPARNASGLTRQYTVAVDAGHGGRDPGNPGSIVNGRRVRESEITLAVALRLERELKKRGVDVFMTRRTDTLIALGDRGPLANERRADLFLSIHTNAANPSWRNGANVRGFETYFLSTARTEDEARVTAMENDVVRFESRAAEPSKGDPLSFILADMAQNEHLRESSDLAATIQQALAGPHPGPNRGVKQGGLVVLTQSHMPAVLVELGFGSNRGDATWMASAAGQQAAAVALAEATIEYLQHYERRTRSSQR